MSCPSQPALLQQEIESTRQACLSALDDGPCGQVSRLLRERGIAGIRARAMVDQVIRTWLPPADLLDVRRHAAELGIPPESRAVERAFLLEQGLAALDQVPSLPSVESVRRLWCKEIELIAAPKDEDVANLAMECKLFIDLCKIVAGKRFPSGQHHWEVSGFPRSWVLRAPARQVPRLASQLLFSLRGFGPFFETHLRFAAPGTPFLQRAFLASFCRMVASLPLQPHIRGLMASSWLYSTDTIRVSPHLGFFREIFLDAGGSFFDLGLAREHDGFLEGSPQRAELYRKGEYRPKFTMALCSRERALEWLSRHHKEELLADNIRL